MKLFIIEYADIMTGIAGYIQVRADTQKQAIEHIKSKYPDYEILDYDVA